MSWNDAGWPRCPGPRTNPARRRGTSGARCAGHGTSWCGSARLRFDRARPRPAGSADRAERRPASIQTAALREREPGRCPGRDPLGGSAMPRPISSAGRPARAPSNPYRKPAEQPRRDRRPAPDASCAEDAALHVRIRSSGRARSDRRRRRRRSATSCPSGAGGDRTRSGAARRTPLCVVVAAGRAERAPGARRGG